MHEASKPEADPMIEVTGHLPPGFMLAGAVRGLFKSPQRVPALPQRQLGQTVRIDPEKVAPYARLCGFVPSQGVPMTWPHILSFPLQMRLMMGADFPYPAMGLVHLSNRIHQRARLNPGDELRLICRAGGFYHHAKGQAFSLETVASRDGQLVWTATSIYLKRGEPGQGLALPVMGTESLCHRHDAWAVSRSLAKTYARLSGDANPIHTSALGARLLGFPRPLAHGMWTKARALASLLPRAQVDVAEAEVSFRNPLLLPGEAELYLGPLVDRQEFECRDPSGSGTYLRGRLSLS